jgi:RimJ/RimL family protein N-acetyltransferase
VSAPEIETGRLILRQWRDEDAGPLAAMNADPEVLRFFPSVQTRAGSDAMLGRLREKWADDGLCFWALEAKGEGFAGFTGLNRPGFTAHFTPCVEIGWRLVRSAWGKGYATEAARASLAYGFGTLGFDEIVAFAVAANSRSHAVMERIGMTRDRDGDFEHPDLAAGSPVRRHVLYRLVRGDWRP